MVNIKTSKITVKSSSKKKLLSLALLIAVLVIGTLAVLEKTHVTNFIGQKQTTDDTDAKTTSPAETAQDGFTGGDEREPGNTLGENKGDGGITDTNGSISGTVDTSSPVVSGTAEISLYTPKENIFVPSGSEMAGASTLSKVSYRLIDDTSGVIATGDLSVINGKFSGKIAYTSTAQTGRLDIFGTRSDGVEFSNIRIPIKLKP